MEVTALCIRLLMTVLLLCGLDQQVDALSLRVEPNRGQFFPFESITLHCDGLHGSATWKVLFQSKEKKPECRITEDTSTRSSCIFKNPFIDDSGEYWCEDGERERSNSINITVTGGSVILESPALPVTEGQDVTLRCRHETASSNFTADFDKDGQLIRSSSTGSMTILNVSRSDEGFYKCSISGAAESSESWLTVRELHTETPTSSGHVFLTFRVVLPMVLMAMLLVLLGLIHCGKLGRKQHELVSTQT